MALAVRDFAGTVDPQDPTASDASRASSANPSDTALGPRLVRAVLGPDRKRRIRTTQWAISAIVYVGAALVLVFGTSQGWVAGQTLGLWCAFIATGLAAIYLAIRSGWSERFDDPALTEAQIVLGVIAVNWGYIICGPARSLALFPLLLIFSFGAFSLSWRRMAWLTVFALTSLVICVVVLHWFRSDTLLWSMRDDALRMDVSNVLMTSLMLPALSLVAGRLSALRTRLHSQREELTAALREIKRVAIRDEVTGLVNRRHMLERLDQEVGRFQRFGSPFSIAVIDLDHFKDINDAYGHAGGDEVLKTFADEAAAGVRTSDLLARWGGEEFLLFMPETRGPAAQAGVERLLARVRALPMKTGTALSFSAGVTEHRAGEPLSETIARADGEMYVAKNAGRSTVLLK